MKTVPSEKKETMRVKNQASGPRSRPCDCGNEIDPVGNPPFQLTPARCAACEETVNRESILRRQAQIKQSRREMIESEIDRVIPVLYRDAKIKDFPPSIQNILLELDGETGLYLWGLPGRGKTYAMAAAGRDFIQAGLRVERVVWERLLCRIRVTYSGKHKSEGDILRPLITCTLLIIEDLGTGTGMTDQESNFALRILLMLIDERIEKHLPTGITSNKSLERIRDSFDDRVFSRIAGYFKVVEFTGPDRRLENDSG